MRIAVITDLHANREAVQAVLKAAQVKVLPCEDAGAEARHFAQAWLYLAPNGDAEDAAGLIEALRVVYRADRILKEIVVLDATGKPATITLPDIPRLIRDIPRIAKAKARPFAGGSATRTIALSLTW